MKRHPRNVEALLDWYRENQPHEIGYVEAVLEAADARGNRVLTAVLGFALQAFEAGRIFQLKNPELPLGGGLHYIQEEPDGEQDPTAGGD